MVLRYSWNRSIQASIHASEETKRYSLLIVIALAINVSKMVLPFRTRASIVGITQGHSCWRASCYVVACYVEFEAILKFVGYSMLCRVLYECNR